MTVLDADRTAENEAVVRRFFTELVGEGDLAVAEELLTTDYVRHDPASPDVFGPDGFEAFMREVRRAFPDLTVEIHDLIATDDRVVVRATQRGTHDGWWGDYEPTGQHIEVDGIVIHRLDGGRIAETWAVWDTACMETQLEPSIEHGIE
ncbi:ester cyclase [Halobium salinum]|uniref:Ester cyclase n=1 Tax=Halobium salinum TaxID=1364940 RepID=A0ABD5PGM4_9EURY|nr:ester cyclase [Halobium salinum]